HQAVAVHRLRGLDWRSGFHQTESRRRARHHTRRNPAQAARRHAHQAGFCRCQRPGTLALLEEAVTAGVKSFIFTSTTSAFGAALTPAAGEPAIWVTEDVTPIPRNIYGMTKVAAEALCQLFFREHRLPAIVLRTSRFFPEDDDDSTISANYEIANVQANEM